MNLIDAANNKTTFVYDQLGRLETQIDPRGKVVTYVYDAVGHLASRIDRIGRTVTYSYDAVGNKTGETWTDGSIQNIQTFTYDAANQQLTAADERQRKRVGCRCLVAKPPRDSDYCQVSKNLRRPASFPARGVISAALDRSWLTRAVR